jgi:hypothetical protein
MNKNYELEREIDEMLRQKELYTDDVSIYEKDTKYPFKALEVQIDGDWKHEHIRLDEVMKANGWMLLLKEMVEDSDGDWYTAKHIYTRWEW